MEYLLYLVVAIARQPLPCTARPLPRRPTPPACARGARHAAVQRAAGAVQAAGGPAAPRRGGERDGGAAWAVGGAALSSLSASGAHPHWVVRVCQPRASKTASRCIATISSPWVGVACSCLKLLQRTLGRRHRAASPTWTGASCTRLTQRRSKRRSRQPRRLLRVPAAATQRRSTSLITCTTLSSRGAQVRVCSLAPPSTTRLARRDRVTRRQQHAALFIPMCKMPPLNCTSCAQARRTRSCMRRPARRASPRCMLPSRRPRTGARRAAGRPSSTSTARCWATCARRQRWAGRTSKDCWLEV